MASEQPGTAGPLLPPGFEECSRCGGYKRAGAFCDCVPEAERVASRAYGWTPAAPIRDRVARSIDATVDQLRIGGPVAILWDDTTCRLEWHDGDEIKEFAANGAWHAENLGYLVYRDEECVVIASRKAENGMHGLLERIPRRAITLVRVLREEAL